MGVIKMEKFTYYKIGTRKFSLEVINDDLYEVTMFDECNFCGTWCFGSYAAAVTHIIGYAEITEKEYESED